MKKIILFTLLFSQISFLSAQSLVVTGDAEHYGDVNVGGHTIEHYLDVTNTSTSPIEVVCQRTIIGTLPAGLPSWGGPTYCFAAFCYNSTMTGLSQSVNINSGATLMHNPIDYDGFVGYYDAEGISGTADVQYCFYDANNPSDETCVTIAYHINNYGCTDPLAINYDPLVTIDDSSCIYCNITNSFISNPPSTSTSCDGFILANGVSNYPIVTYNWTNSQGSFMGSSNFISNLCNDAYILTLTDSAGCT